MVVRRYCLKLCLLLLLRSHSRKHQELEFKFSCEHCDYKTKLPGHLKRHMRVHEKEDGKIYKCPHCDYACNNSVSTKRSSRDSKFSLTAASRFNFSSSSCLGKSSEARLEDE